MSKHLNPRFTSRLEAAPTPEPIPPDAVTATFVEMNAYANLMGSTQATAHSYEMRRGAALNCLLAEVVRERDRLQAELADARLTGCGSLASSFYGRR